MVAPPHLPPHPPQKKNQQKTPQKQKTAMEKVRLYRLRSLTSGKAYTLLGYVIRSGPAKIIFHFINSKPTT